LGSLLERRERRKRKGEDSSKNNTRYPSQDVRRPISLLKAGEVLGGEKVEKKEKRRGNAIPL